MIQPNQYDEPKILMQPLKHYFITQFYEMIVASQITHIRRIILAGEVVIKEYLLLG